jgi:hypothetical protein
MPVSSQPSSAVREDQLRHQLADAKRLLADSEKTRFKQDGETALLKQRVQSCMNNCNAFRFLFDQSVSFFHG